MGLLYKLHIHVHSRADQQRQKREAEEKSREIELCIIKNEQNKPLELDCSTMVGKILQFYLKYLLINAGSIIREKEKRNH